MLSILWIINIFLFLHKFSSLPPPATSHFVTIFSSFRFISSRPQWAPPAELTRIHWHRVQIFIVQCSPDEIVHLMLDKSRMDDREHGVGWGKRVNDCQCHWHRCHWWMSFAHWNLELRQPRARVQCAVDLTVTHDMRSTSAEIRANSLAPGDYVFYLF